MGDDFLAGQLVAETITTGRLGTPVAARMHLALRAAADPVDQLASAIAAASEWLRLQPERLWCRAAGNTNHLIAHVIGRAGQSLLVSVGGPSNSASPLKLVIVGNRGMAAWEAGDESEPMPEGLMKPRDERLVRALHVALVSAQPVAVDNPQAAAESPASMTTAKTPTPRPGLKFAAPQPPLGVLLVAGNHSHQENYARAFAQDARCRLVGLTDEDGLPARRRELNARLAQELNIPLLDDFDAAIHRRDVQIVSVCAAPERRARLIQRCAAAGKHLYLDKPLAADIAESDAIVAAVERAGVQAHMFSLVHTNFAQRVRRAVQSGELGELLAVHADAFFAKGMSGTADLGRIRRETARPTLFEAVEAKRELHNVGVYSLVLLRWLLGRSVRRVFANTCNYFFAEHQQLDMEDYAHLTLELDGGVIATVATGRTGWRSHAAGGMNRVTLVGTKKTVCVDWYKPRLEVWADEEPWQLPRKHPEDPMGFWTSTTVEAGGKPKLGWLTPAESTGDARFFVDCLIAGRASDVTAADGAAVMEMLMAAYESASTGKAVSLPLPR